MILGERSYGGSVHVPPWSFSPENDPVSFPLSPSANGGGGVSVDDYALFFHGDALQRYLPSNTEDDVVGGFIFSDLDKINGDGDFLSVDAHTCDNFRMFDFKVKKCTRGRSHDWTECPFAHPGEKAQRRDPKKFHYSGTACPDFRRGSCCKGDSCEFAHGVFECWLHPARYRTQPCKDGMNCKRRVCFFAHSSDQLRVLSPRADFYDGAPHRFPFMSAPESDSPPVESPPMSPMTSNSVNEVVASLRRLQLSKLNSMPNSWANGSSSPRFNMTRPVFFSLPNTPTRPVARPGIGYFDSWENAGGELEPVMERVESGRDLRAKMFEKLSKENPLERVDPDPNLNPDFGWVSEVLN